MKAAPAQEQSSRDKILDAAERLFAQRGYSGVGLSEVAEAAGLGKSSLFHHFETKARLYAAVAARILRSIEEHLVRSLAKGGDPVVRLERWLDELIDLLAANPTYARVLLRSLFEDDELAGDLPEELQANDAIQRFVGALGLLIKEGVAAGAFHPVSVTHTLQTLIGATVYHFASGEFGDELIGRPIFTPSEVKRRKDEVKALFRHGLVARPASPSSRRPRRNRP